MQEALDKYSPILDQTMDDIRSHKAQLGEQRQALEESADTVDRIQQDLTEHIRWVELMVMMMMMMMIRAALAETASVRVD